jgi:hypothetical protein
MGNIKFIRPSSTSNRQDPVIQWAVKNIKYHIQNVMKYDGDLKISFGDWMEREFDESSDSPFIGLSSASIFLVSPIDGVTPEMINPKGLKKTEDGYFVSCAVRTPVSSNSFMYLYVNIDPDLDSHLCYTLVKD